MMFMVYGRSNCVYCEKATELLRMRGMEYAYIDIQYNETLKKHFEEQGYSTVPVILIEDEIIGGYTDLVDFIKLNY